MRRDGEEVLREPVVDLARDPRAFFGNCPSELCVADRAPCAGKQESIRKQPQRVAARDGARRQDRREHVMKGREQHQGRAEREPAVEVLAALVEAFPKADDREKIQECLSGQRARQQARSLGARIDRGEDAARGAQCKPAEDEHDARGDRGVRERSGSRPSGHEGRCRDECPREQPTRDTCPCLRSVDGLSVEDGRNRERDDGNGRDQEAGAEEEVEASALDREPDPREEGDDPAGERHDRLQYEAELRERELRLELMVGDEECKRGAEQAEQEDLPPQPGLEVVSAVLPHLHSCRQIEVRR
jgi:hypothetical protein